MSVFVICLNRQYSALTYHLSFTDPTKNVIGTTYTPTPVIVAAVSSFLGGILFIMVVVCVKRKLKKVSQQHSLNNYPMQQMNSYNNHSRNIIHTVSETQILSPPTDPDYAEILDYMSEISARRHAIGNSAIATETGSNSVYNDIIDYTSDTSSTGRQCNSENITTRAQSEPRIKQPLEPQTATANPDPYSSLADEMEMNDVHDYSFLGRNENNAAVRFPRPRFLACVRDSNEYQSLLRSRVEATEYSVLQNETHDTLEETAVDMNTIPE